MPAGTPDFSALNARRCRVGGVVLLLGAIVALAVAWFGGQREEKAQGPYALAAVGGQLLIGDHGRVMRVDAHGRLLGEETTVEFGIDAPVSLLVPVDESRYLIASASGRRLIEMHAQSGYTGRWVDLQWPEDLGKAAGQGAFFAASPPNAAGSFDIAAATGDSVLLFNERGQLKARTAAGLHRLARGLVHTQQGWWTTDAQRFKLRRLDLATLRELSVIELEEGHTERFPGQVLLSQGAPLPAVPGMQPLLTLTRLDRAGRLGRVVDVFPDAREAEFRVDAPIAPRGIAWLGGALVVLDGEGQRLLTFGAARQSLASFGDATLAGKLAELRAERRQAGQLRLQMLALAALLLASGVLLLLWPRWRAVRWPWPAPAADATKAPDFDRWWRLWLPVFWPLPVLAGAASLFALRLPPGGAPGLALLIVVALLVWLFRLHRHVADPRFESVINHRALNWLARSPLWPAMRRREEKPLEVLAVRQGWQRGILLLTNYRLLFWLGGIERASLLGEWPRQKPLAARLEAAGGFPWEGRKQLMVEHDGIAESWQVASPVTAARLCTRMLDAGDRPAWAANRPMVPSALAGGQGASGSLSFDGLVPLDDEGQVVRAAGLPPEAPAAYGPEERDWPALVARAAILPGWGQARQGRYAAAVILLSAALGHVAFAVLPLVGTGLFGRGGASGLAIAWAFAGWALLAGAAAFDVWRKAVRGTG